MSPSLADIRRALVAHRQAGRALSGPVHPGPDPPSGASPARSRGDPSTGPTHPDPDLLPGSRAAVAVVLCQGQSQYSGVSLLLIERARKEGDPWSGDLAFPGGRVEPGDADEAAAAERETLEEVGLDLSGSERLGRLAELSAQIQPMAITAFAYAVAQAGTLHPSEEVRDAFWVPLGSLLNPGRRRVHALRLPSGQQRRFPAVELPGDRPLLWGVTYRILCHLAALAGQDLPLRAD